MQQSVIVTTMTREQLQQKKVDPQHIEGNKTFNKIYFDASQKPILQESIVVLNTQIEKNIYNNPIQMKIIEKANEVIKMLLDFDESMGTVEQGGVQFKSNKTNLSSKLSKISSELLELYAKAKSQNLPLMSELNQMIQNMLQGELYSKYCSDVLTAFSQQNFRFQCSRYLAVEYL